MSAIHPGNLHGTGSRTNKSRYHYARQRVQDAQKGKVEETDGLKKEDREPKPSSSHNGIMVILVVMIVVTWGVAATAYFGIVDYKGIVARGSKITAVDATEYVTALYPFQYNAIRHPLKSLGNFLSSIDDTITNMLTFTRAPFQIIDKRRQVTGSPVPRLILRNSDLTKRYSGSLQAVPDEAPTPETKRPQEDVGQAKGSKPSEEGRQKQPEPSKPPEEKPKPAKDTQSQDKPDAKVEKPKEPSKKKPKTLSEDDKLILNQLKEGEKLLTQKKGEQAWRFFKQLAEKHPESPKARFNRAKAEELVAEQQRSNPMLLQAIKSFEEVAEMTNCPKQLKKSALIEKSEKEMFLGRMKPALETQLKVAKLYPKDINVLNKLGVRYLMLGQNKVAKKVYEQVLNLAPDDGFALVHMGFILKNEGSWAKSIPFLKRGTESEAPGTQEGKFYFHLGDALHRTNHSEEAERVYEKAAKRGLFRSKYQRSLYNVDRLRGKPFWTPEEAGVKDYVRRLQLNWKIIRDEALALFDKDTGLFLLEEESLKDTGEWRQLTLFQRGVKNENNCRRTPKTCGIIDRMPNAKGCKRGQVKFSVMMPGTHVWPHTGPTNCRLRMHLGLVIPTTGSGARLACAGEMRTWEEGKVLIFDDSFEHEVWQEAESFRMILIVDVWHPDLTEHERKTLSAI